MLTRDQAQKIAERTLKLTTFPECSVSFSETEQAFVRFANNGITTSGLSVERRVGISVTRDGKTGSYITESFADDALKAAVARAEEMAALAPPDPERMPPLGAQTYGEYEHWDERTASARSPQMIPHVKAIVDQAVSKKLVAAGFIQRTAGASAIATSAGNFGFQRRADSSLSTTVRNTGGTSSGWAGQDSVKLTDLNGADLASQAVNKCLRWSKPARLEPGKYTVVLEPAAVSELMMFLGFQFSARLAEEGRSFLSRKGGGTLLGEKLFSEAVTLRSDPSDPRLPSMRWTEGGGPRGLGSFDVGLPTAPTTWVEKGVVKNLVYDRYWALKSAKRPTPSTTGMILDGTDASTADLVKSTDRGLLVTRFWYIRVLNPQTVQLTGLTRDGLFLIEKGEISQPVMNFRFNESPVRMLANVQRLGRTARSANRIMPAVQAADFTMASISDAV